MERLGAVRAPGKNQHSQEWPCHGFASSSFSLASVPLIRISLLPLLSRITSRPSSWVAPRNLPWLPTSRPLFLPFRRRHACVQECEREKP